MLNRSQIFATNDLKSEVIDVPEWGGQVKVVVMTGLARDAFQKANSEAPRGVSFFEGTLIVATVVGDDDQPLFTEDDIPLLQQRSAAVVSRIAAVAMRINGLGVKATEDAEKNSEAAPSGSSGSDSPAS
ncbi:hypothetical protein [Caballeronia sp. LZ043]|uniref:hypothetical protein n=1 Tax=Caballeronia sp. LZ043 TaxID=3038569 RepID=UPI00285B5ABE|nr:hypothetical protein [Caballeronia sp. LZ043]MDR5825791.1 hypothetical protein [Caballeronia sp. LZ043]